MTETPKAGSAANTAARKRAALLQRWEPQWIPDNPQWQQARRDVLALCAENDRLWEAVGCAEAHFEADTDEEATAGEQEFYAVVRDLRTREQSAAVTGEAVSSTVSAGS